MKIFSTIVIKTFIIKSFSTKQRSSVAFNLIATQTLHIFRKFRFSRRRREFLKRISLDSCNYCNFVTCTRQYQFSTALISFRQRHQIAAVEDGLEIRVVDVELLEPVGIELPDGEIAFEQLLRHRQTEFLGSEKPQQEQRVRSAVLDRGMFLDPVTELFQRLLPYVIVLAQLQSGRFQRVRVQRVLVLVAFLLSLRRHHFLKK